MFEFYEIVEIVACPRWPHLVGKSGYLAGKSYEDGGPIQGYAVFVFDVEEVFSFQADQLKSLGTFIDPAQVFSGEAIRVRNVGGRGIIVHDD